MIIVTGATGFTLTPNIRCDLAKAREGETQVIVTYMQLLHYA